MLTREQFVAFSDLVSGIFATHPPVTVTSITAEGDVFFKVSLKSLKLDSPALTRSHFLLCSRYAANLIGEWLVRMNFDAFSDLRTPEEMKNAARAYNHKSFGMLCNKKGQCLEFMFHASLLDRISEPSHDRPKTAFFITKACVSGNPA